MHIHRRAIAAGLALAMTLGALPASADVVDPDADVVTAGNQGVVNLGTVGAGATITRQVSFSLRCSGRNHADVGQTLSLSFDPDGSTLPVGAAASATSTSIGPVPASWPDDHPTTNNCGTPAPTPLQDAGNAVVTLTAPTGPGTYLVNLRWDILASPTGADDDRATADHTSVEFSLRVQGELVPPTVDCQPPAIGWSPAEVEVPCTASDVSGLARPDDAAFVLRTSVGAGQEDANAPTDGRSVCDIFGNCAPAGPFTFAVDRRAPRHVTPRPDREPDRGPWYRDPLTVTWSGEDGGSGIAACTQRTYDGPDAPDASLTGRCTDVAGNESDPVPFAFRYDATRPSIEVRLLPGPGAGGWWNRATGAPSARFLCDDATSTIDDCPPDQAIGEGADQAVEGTARDRAGNSRRARAEDIDVDLTDPGLIWEGGPADGGTYPFGAVPAAPTCRASDALSGPATCTVAGHGTAVGTWDLTATAIDVAGNTTHERRSYRVLGWTIEGFGPPVKASGGIMEVKGGRALPLRFRVRDADGALLTELAAVSGLHVEPIDCGTRSPTGPAQPMASVGGGLRVDPSDGRFAIEWKVPVTPGCHRASVVAADGSRLDLDVRAR